MRDADLVRITCAAGDIETARKALAIWEASGRRLPEELAIERDARAATVAVEALRDTYSASVLWDEEACDGLLVTVEILMDAMDSRRHGPLVLR